VSAKRLSRALTFSDRIRDSAGLAPGEPTRGAHQYEQRDDTAEREGDLPGLEGARGDGRGGPTRRPARR